MARRVLNEDRCERCYLRKEVCYCAELPKIELKTRVAILMHWSEFKATTNTGRWVNLILPNSEIRLRGQKSAPMSLAGLWDKSTQPLFLYPSENSEVLSPKHFEKPVTLIVPDGKWRQASKVWRREPELANVPCVRIPPGPRSRYLLRRPPQPHCLSTMEAIARALGVLESPEAEHALIRVFDEMVSRTFLTRSPDARAFREAHLFGLSN